MHKTGTRKYLIPIMALLAMIGLTAATTVSAQTISADHGSWMSGPGRGGRGMARPVVVGTVLTVSGTTLTVSGHEGFATTTPTTTYAIDAANARVIKNNAPNTLSSIVIGDTIVAQGTVSGTNVTATMIGDGAFPNGIPNGLGRFHGNQNASSSLSLIAGNGQPVVAGSVVTTSGTTLSITNKSNVTYTIDASSAKIMRGSDTVSLSSVAVGDTVVVQGTVNGTSVIASTIIDQTAPANANISSGVQPQSPLGFFGRMGQFFLHLFGF